MDIFDEEILRLWQALEENNVKYIMIGGYATNLNGYQRYTGDIDIWIKDSKENRLNLGKAMKLFGYDEINWVDLELIPGWTDFYLMNGMKLDILIDMKGLEDYTFDECLDLATIAKIENVTIPFLHINHLIANKKAVNRSKDQIDVMELEKIKVLRKEMGLD